MKGLWNNYIIMKIFVIGNKTDNKILDLMF